MGYELLTWSLVRKSTFFYVYVITFFICFVMQAAIAHYDGGMLMPNKNTNRVEFFEDYYNMLNYFLVVPLYFVAGFGYMTSLFSLKERMIQNRYLAIDDTSKPYLSGLLACGIVILILILAQAQYAYDVQHKATVLFWFHGTEIESAFQFRGYVYLLVNAILATFVISVALLHLELFRWSSDIATAIKNRTPADDVAEDSFWCNGCEVKKVFSPFTETAIWSKLFAVTLAINLYTWKMSGVNGNPNTGDNAIFVNIIFIVYIVLALWIVSLPRYRIQYEIFKLRRKMNMHEYMDIRMPWTLGWSAFIDFLLIAFLSHAVIGSEFIKFFSDFITVVFL